MGINRGFGHVIHALLVVCIVASVGCGDSGTPTLDTEMVPDACEPACIDRVCGDDSCGGSCGTCPDEQKCAVGQCYDIDFVANPDPIDFGDVQSGEFADIDVIITNSGTLTVELQEVYLDYEGSFDFSIMDIAPWNTESGAQLAPGDSINITLRYDARLGGCDDSLLILLTEIDSEQLQWKFDVKGCQVGPKIRVVPESIDFEYVPKDVTKSATIYVFNDGNADLTISSVVTALGSDTNLTVKNGPAEGVPDIVPPGGQEDYTVEWTATVSGTTHDGTPGAIVISSNDVVASPNVVPVYGLVEVPAIELVPSEIDFGFGAQNTPKMAYLTIKNNGWGDLKIQSLEIVNPSTTEYGSEFQIVYNPEFPVTSPTNPVESTIAGNSFIPVELTFTNKGPDNGDVTATLVVTSNSPGSEIIEVPLSAKRSRTAFCRPQLVPTIGNFGVVAVGFTYEKEVRLVNTGTGNCTVEAWKIADCTTDMYSTTCPTQPLSGTDSAYFKMKKGPPVTPGGLRAGQQASMSVEFTPPAVTDVFNLLASSKALLSFRLKDDNSGTTYTIPDATTCDAMSGCAANLTAQSGVAKAAILPDHIDFGAVTNGCYSQTYSVCVYNSGNAPMKITNIELYDCTPEFHLNNVPTLPNTVGTGAPVCFQTNYSPADEGVDMCSIHLSVTDMSAPVIAIPLKGEGTTVTRQTDEFIQTDGDEVDILFVVDDSGSMCEEQDRLAASFNEFIAKAAVWNNDYHIGVISVNVINDAVIGRLNRGDDSVTPRYITKSVNAPAQFRELVELGCDGGSDPQEAGLQAAQTAMAGPLTTDLGYECDSTMDCTANTNICADAATCQYTCIAGTCGGYNKGFLRDDARLEVIFLSDEEDQSIGYVTAYAGFLTGIKGAANHDRVHLNAIVGVAGVPAGDSSSCTASDGGTAANGARYIAAAEATNGVYGSICESSFGPVMSDIADAAFTPRVRFRLSRQAVEAGLTVSIDSNGNGQFVQCSDGWEYDSDTNSIIFDAEGACMPSSGDHVKIAYDALCVAD